MEGTANWTDSPEVDNPKADTLGTGSASIDGASISRASIDRTGRSGADSTGIEGAERALSPAAVVTLDQATVRLQGLCVLEEISLTLPAGEFLAVLGPNGSGKTTLLRLITGMLAPDSGTVRVWDRSARHPGPLRRRIGYLPQKGILDARFPITAADAVMMGRFARIGPCRRPRRSDREAVSTALEQLGILDLAHRPIRRLSGGQRQRVFLARALVNAPQLLVLDEPTSAMDTEAEERVYAVLQNLHQQGTTIILVTHDIAAVSTYVDRVACLNRRLVAHGLPSLVMNEDVFEAMYGCHSMFFAHGDSPHMVVGRHE